jgi:IMP dehydrogenase/GMP reductase
MPETGFELALTFDDILLVPQYSEIVPSEVNTAAEFARGKKLNIPIISSAMDTVTEHKVAQKMAQLGGLGIIHKNLTIEDQAQEVERVKKYESGMIQDPITLGPDNLVSEALDLMSKYKISGVPITVKGKLVGILTNRDLRFENNTKQPIKNLSKPAKFCKNIASKNFRLSIKTEFSKVSSPSKTSRRLKTFQERQKILAAGFLWERLLVWIKRLSLALKL